MTGETPHSDNADELRRLWDVSPASDGIGEEAEDYIIAQRAAEGEDPTPEFVAKIGALAGEFSALSEEDLEAKLADAKSNSPFAKYMREVLYAVTESSTVSPVPYHRSLTAGNPGGFTQVEWEALPESTQRLLRKDDDPETE